MDFAYSPRVTALIRQLGDFYDHHILAHAAEWDRETGEGRFPLHVIEPLKAKARAANLWNLFLPALGEEQPGVRLTNLEFAPLAERMGRQPWTAEIFNCSAPDTGNMELLHLFGSASQRRQWLMPLLDGAMRSCFAMTEPDVASSDATNIRTTIRREGQRLVLDGRKWFATGALHPHCRFVIVLGLSSELQGAPEHARHSMVIVPLDTPGLTIVRNVPVLDHLSPTGHCEINFENVQLPSENMLGSDGEGFAMAQARLGPGRVHHCMRAIGQAELALEMMCARVKERRAFGKTLGQFANVQDWIAESRIEIEQARLLVLRTAAKLDEAGNRAARVDVSAIKVVASRLLSRVVDRAIQSFGAMGLTPDTPLAGLHGWARSLRFVDGPDEVHLSQIARAELNRTI